ncbi:MAG: NAD(P)-dependent alcohol dehydrogenase [Proteobacteria bacterium]|nr:NAD(P)-dependent alcohol dehydrogenase [Pseudomonadota bacterium]
MEACIYKKFGKESVLEWVDGWPKPVCKSDSVIVEVAASSINPKDALLRRGKFRRTLARDPLPRLTGLDVSGTVVEVGGNVARIKVGDAVFGMTNKFSGGVLSTFAEFKETEVAKAPISISLVDAASIPLAAQTALQALRDICGVNQGKKVLITGASGGVGHFAIQIAIHLGAEVHGICSTDNIEFVSSLGAHCIYDYKKNEPAAIDNQYDAIFDAAGRYKREYFSPQLGKNGIFVTTVPSGKSLLSELMARLKVSKKSRLVFVHSSYKDLSQLADWIDSGKLSSHIQKVYEKNEIVEAHTQIQSGHSRGKIIVVLMPCNVA